MSQSECLQDEEVVVEAEVVAAEAALEEAGVAGVDSVVGAEGGREVQAGSGEEDEADYVSCLVLQEEIGMHLTCRAQLHCHGGAGVVPRQTPS